jgi:hypothetical protein
MREADRDKFDSKTGIHDDYQLQDIVDIGNNNLIVFNHDGTVSRLIEFFGKNNSSFGEVEYESFFSSLYPVIASFDTKETTVQFVMVKDVAKKVETHNEMPKHLTERQNSYNSFVDGGVMYHKRFFLSISFTPSNAKSVGFVKRNSRIIKNVLFDGLTSRDRQEIYEEKQWDIKNRVQKLDRAIDIVKQTLTANKVRWKVMKNKQEYWDVLQKFTRPSKSRVDSIAIDSDVESPAQTLFSGVTAETSKYGFFLDKYYHRVYTIDRLPQATVFGDSLTTTLLSAPYEMIYQVNLRAMSFEETNKHFSRKISESKLQQLKNDGAIENDYSLDVNQNKAVEAAIKAAEIGEVGIQTSVNLTLKVPENEVKRVFESEGLSEREYCERLDDSLAHSVFGQFGSSEWIAEDCMHWQNFIANLPCSSSLYSDSFKTETIMPLEVPYLLPLFDIRRDDLTHDGVNHLYLDVSQGTPRGILPFDLFDSTLNAFNYLIFGSTGMGKSVLINLLVSMVMAKKYTKNTKPITRIIDIGGDGQVGSFKKIVKLFDGEEINFSKLDKPHIQILEVKPEQSIATPEHLVVVAKKIMKATGLDDIENVKLLAGQVFGELIDMPIADRKKTAAIDKIIKGSFNSDPGKIRDFFILKPGQCEPNSEDFNIIMSLFSVMVAPESSIGSGFAGAGIDHDAFSSLIQSAYRKTPKRFPRISDVIAIAKDLSSDIENDPFQPIVKAVSKWSLESGVYKFFDQETNVNFDNPFIVFDLNGIKRDKKLQIIYTTIINKIIDDDMYNKFGVPRLKVMDENWELMKISKEMSESYIGAMRKARKYKFATISATQGPMDYFADDPSIGEAIIGNAQATIFCGFSDSDTVSIQRAAETYNVPLGAQPELSNLGVKTMITDDGREINTHARAMMLLNRKGGRECYLVDNLLSKFEYMLYSSSADDNLILSFLQDQRGAASVLDAIDMVVCDAHIWDDELVEFLNRSNAESAAKDILAKRKAVEKENYSKGFRFKISPKKKAA